MFWVLNPEGHVYVDGTTKSHDCLMRAIRKFDPKVAWSQKAKQRAVWLEMKDRGYTIFEKQSTVPNESMKDAGL